MPTLRLKTQNFPSGSAVPNRTSAWTISWQKLVWAAITVGRGSSADVIQHGPFSVFEILYRCALVYANLKKDTKGSFVQTSAYIGLDPSEKCAVSYFLGLSLSKAFAEEKLHVPWLMHVDVYRSRFGLSMAKGVRPDLFGLDRSGRWVVAESKGRSGGHSQKALAKAKAQAAQVVSIGGTAPYISLGLVTSFASGRLQLVVDDPPASEDGEELSWNVTEQDFRQDYLRPIRTLLAELPSRVVSCGDRKVDVVHVQSADVDIGIARPVSVEGKAESPDKANGEIEPDDFKNTDPRIVSPKHESSDSTSFIGEDDVFVGLGESWSNEQMSKEPQLRLSRRESG